MVRELSRPRRGQVNAVRLLARDRGRRDRRRDDRRSIPGDPVGTRRDLRDSARPRRRLVLFRTSLRSHARPPRALALAVLRCRAGLGRHRNCTSEVAREPERDEALGVLLPGHGFPRVSRLYDQWRPGRGLLRAVLQYSLFPPMAPDRGLADLGLRVRRSARSDRDVERARLGLAAGGVDLPGRPGAPA